MTNVNQKTSKKGLVQYLETVKVEDKSLADRIAYTLKKLGEDSRNVLKDDLLELAQDVMDFITPQQLPMENALKPAKKEEKETPKAPVEDKKVTEKSSGKKKTASIKKADESKEEVPAKKEVAPKKSPTKKVETPKENIKKLDLVATFPETIEYDELGKLKLNLDIKSIEDVHQAITDGKNLIFAMYWNARHLKQFTYDVHAVSGKMFKSFPNDLDLTFPIHVSEEGKVVYVVSTYSEALFVIKPDDLEVIDGMRYSAGMEYNIYEIIE